MAGRLKVLGEDFEERNDSFFNVGCEAQNLSNTFMKAALDINNIEGSRASGALSNGTAKVMRGSLLLI